MSSDSSDSSMSSESSKASASVGRLSSYFYLVAESNGAVEILGSIPKQIFVVVFVFSFVFVFYFVLSQLRITGRNRAAPRRTFVHISTSSCNPRGRAHIFAI